MTYEYEPLCVYYGHQPNFDSITQHNGVLCCGYCDEPMDVDEIKVGLLELEMTKPDYKLIQTTVHPFFGKSFVVHENYEPTRREKIFGRRRRLRGDVLRYGPL